MCVGGSDKAEQVGQPCHVNRAFKKSLRRPPPQVEGKQEGNPLQLTEDTGAEPEAPGKDVFSSAPLIADPLGSPQERDRGEFLTVNQE